VLTGGRAGHIWARGPDLGQEGLLLVASSRVSPCNAGHTGPGARRLCPSGVVPMLPSGFGLLRVCPKSRQRGGFCLARARSRMPGRRPWMVGTLWVGGRARGSGAG
jgi:hypothetical protein